MEWPGVVGGGGAAYVGADKCMGRLRAGEGGREPVKAMRKCTGKGKKDGRRLRVMEAVREAE